MSAPVTVDIWSDIACPWCFVGKRRFERAVAAFDGEVEVTFHSYELAPDTPPDFNGSEVDFLVRHKGMPATQVEQMLGQMTELAAGEGLAYDFAALRHTNTHRAHELLHLAKDHGAQPRLKELLLSAYFEQGRHLGTSDVLVALAVEAGLDGDEARAALEDRRYSAAVQADVDRAVELGISGVPFFVFDGRLGVSGAQDPAVFAQVLRRAVHES